MKDRPPCHSAVGKKASHRSAPCHHCSSCYAVLHSHRPAACLSPSSPPFQLVHPAQVWLRKRCVSLPREPAQCVILFVWSRAEECLRVIMHLSFWMMSCFLISLPLFFCTPRPALLLLSVPPAPLPLDSVLVFVSSLLVSVSLSSPVGIDAGQQSIREFQSLCFFFFFFFSSLFPFSVLIVLQ